uniref:Uncharacterized protein n=1 Tax=Candidatus Kentrum sp. FW TaxID=2126338 RepID=A0A450TTF1_9GAMM|nr:MAG: hypothetical protein BECKFW1821C_GA0114237_103019 [Candidatus Kentron sp. FW]
MTPGTFLFDSNFRFHDGKLGNKIFVILSNGSNGIYIAVKTTSRGNRYGIQHGCQILDRFPNYYLVEGSCEFLSKNTWIQLDSFYELKSEELMEKIIMNRIRRLGIIGEKDAIDLLTCATHSEDLSYFQEMVIQGAIDTFQNKRLD